MFSQHASICNNTLDWNPDYLRKAAKTGFLMLHQELAQIWLNLISERSCVTLVAPSYRLGY
jgi:hypothetical protein